MDYMDLLSSLGVASAHPGGFAATKKLLERVGPPGELRILEVGCGTGKTACYMAKNGYRVTAIEQHPVMLEKARERAEKEGVTGVEWVQGDVHALPFDDEAFDVLLAESVTIFTNIHRSLAEYFRVLKPKGRLFDRELVRYKKIPAAMFQEWTEYLKTDSLLSRDEWLSALRQAGFRCEAPPLENFRSQEYSGDPDEINELDLSKLLDPEIGQGLMRYTQLMFAQESYFRVCEFQACKD
ncbi:class I SAM-dependent methyltransferase [Cohnella nanjingensis]|uniref:Methyltransferase domain-containing protein n=1 Tax=Cohnella nanjingensis TaxID=1387779 RepID=A0A7X0RL67_9BACL|nr:class I SAM-dependent methyltransferase [Cohnella nanjingensis]MBB6669485.1 methyltransferase domain-containing protein [Cohnella nanjingensis]